MNSSFCVRSTLAVLVLLSGLPSVSAELQDPVPLTQFAIPESLGKIEERHIGTRDRWIIQIQDIHAHATAQENIAAILDHLNAVYGIQKIALEGNWGKTSYAEVWEIQNSAKKQLLLRTLMENAIISGAGYAASFSRTPLVLTGIEDPALYEENRRAFLKHLAGFDAAHQTIAAEDTRIENQKASLYSPELLVFDKAYRKFREGEKAEQFLPALLEMAASQQINIQDLGQIVLLREIIQTASAVKKTKLEAEAGRLMPEYQREGLHFEELLKSGKIQAEKLAYYPETARYLQLMQLQDKLSHHDLFAQIEAAVKRVKTTLMTAEDEKLLDARAERFYIARQILNLKATPDDLKKYAVVQDLTDEELRAAGLAEAFMISMGFYALAKQRDEEFFRKIESDPELAGNFALVAGGFHTGDMIKRYRQAGYSYLVITPDLGGLPPDEALYTRRLNDALAVAETLSSDQNRTIRAPAYIPEGFSVLLETNDARKAAAAVDTALLQAGTRDAALKAAATSAEAFTDDAQFDDAARVELLKGWLSLAFAGTETIAIAGLQDNLLRNDRLFSSMAANSRNHFVVIVPSSGGIDERLLGTPRNVHKLAAESLRAALTMQQARGLLERFVKERLAAAVDPDMPPGGFLVFQPSDWTLLIIRPVLEGYLQWSDNPEIQARFFSIVDRLMTSVESLRQSLESA